MPPPPRAGSGVAPPEIRVDGAVRCAENVAADERLLRDARPVVRVARLADVALSWGAGLRDTGPIAGRAGRLGVPLVRRGSGGSGVLHGPGDLAWSVVLPRDDPRAGRDFVRAYGRFGAGVVDWLAARRLTGVWSSPPNVSSECCLLGGRGEVLRVGGRVVGGAAQHVTRVAVLHHGILPYRVDRPLAVALFHLDAPGAIDLLAGLDDLGIAEPSEALAPTLAASVASRFAADLGATKGR